MSNVNGARYKKTPRPLKPSIRRDGIPAWAYLKIHQTIACEDCSHFKHSDSSCTLGNMTSYHLAEFQKAEFERTGKVALCRFMEID